MDIPFTGNSGKAIEVLPLSELQQGESGIVVRIAAGSRLRSRLREMGFVPDVAVEVMRSAPLSDPVEYRLKGYFISLRREEARDILVRKLDGKNRQNRFRFRWGHRNQAD